MRAENIIALKTTSHASSVCSCAPQMGKRLNTFFTFLLLTLSWLLSAHSSDPRSCQEHVEYFATGQIYAPFFFFYSLGKNLCQTKSAKQSLSVVNLQDEWSVLGARTFG